MRNFMYLRPGNFYKDFVVEENRAGITSIGRPKPDYNDSGTKILSGVLAEADDRQKVRWEQLQHPISHTIVQIGSPKAKPEDKLIFGGRVFFIKGVDEAGSLGICTIYYVEERTDVK